ncbi:hypothetical protein OsJ_34859 [Oryza sativa Japonica Group]|uniref:BHLH domain-containing protein n=1 Tax=Oryza sativa subsp. japonica TaxID=39947 RepID=A3CE00_ORYSJ|nr:hypothetical protein OsJ_34859 [Oryza sativa Japonica Group]
MAHDGFLGGGGGSFHAMAAWPLPFDAAAALHGGGWDSDPALGELVPSPVGVGVGAGVHKAALMDELASRLGGVCGGGLGGGGVPSPPSSVASPEPGTKAKKCKLSADAAGDEDTKPVAGDAGHGGNGKGKVLDAAGEPPKDYIHVRARRGQATDSHSLAERVRREKISERMKLLQDLVPGCNKVAKFSQKINLNFTLVTGKAVMLDEIINYVQSLQRQVEFLSMKLSTVNPQLDFDVDNFIPKDASDPIMPAPLSLPPPPATAILLTGGRKPGDLLRVVARDSNAERGDKHQTLRNGANICKPPCHPSSLT